MSTLRSRRRTTRPWGRSTPPRSPRATRTRAGPASAPSTARATTAHSSWTRTGTTSRSSTTTADCPAARVRRGDEPPQMPRVEDGAIVRRRRLTGLRAWTDSDMHGGPVDELLDVAVARPALEQLEVEVGRTLEDGVKAGLTSDDRE